MRNKFMRSTPLSINTKQVKLLRGLISKAVKLGQKLGHVFLTTADGNGIPHLSIAAKINVSTDNRLSVAGWFCPGTVANLENNPNIGITVWDKKSDIGFQFIGKRQELRELAVLDGYAPKTEKDTYLPQIEREVVISVEKILEFKQAPHSDIEN